MIDKKSKIQVLTEKFKYFILIDFTTKNTLNIKDSKRLSNSFAWLQGIEKLMSKWTGYYHGYLITAINVFGSNVEFKYFHAVVYRCPIATLLHYVENGKIFISNPLRSYLWGILEYKRNTKQFNFSLDFFFDYNKIAQFPGSRFEAFDTEKHKKFREKLLNQPASGRACPGGLISSEDPAAIVGQLKQYNKLKKKGGVKNKEKKLRTSSRT